MTVFGGVPCQHVDVFPEPIYVVSEVSQVLDFKASKRPDGSRPQARDKVTGQPLWELLCLDSDERARKTSKTISVKFAADYPPVLPENTSGFPLTPVEFVGLVAVPYVDSSSLRVEEGKIEGKPRIMWSFRAQRMVAPGQSAAKVEPRKGAA